MNRALGLCNPELERFGLVDGLEVLVLLVFVVERAIAGGERCGGEYGSGTGNRVAVLVDLHAERETHLSKDFLDLVEALAAEVLGLQHLGLGLLDQLADGRDVGVLEAVVAAHRELELLNGTVQVLVADCRTIVIGKATRLHLLLEVDEDVHVVFQQLCRETESVSGKNGAVRPDLERELVVVGDLTETRGLDEVVHLADGRVNAVDRDEADTEVGVEVLVGRDVPTTALEAHLHIDAAAFGDRADVDIGIENLDVRVSLDHARGDDARLVDVKVEGLGAVAVELERNLLQVEDDVGRILDDAGDRLELVQHTLDLDGGDCRALDGREQRAAQRVADGSAEPALKRLRGELAVVVG